MAPAAPVTTVAGTAWGMRRVAVLALIVLTALLAIGAAWLGRYAMAIVLLAYVGIAAATGSALRGPIVRSATAVFLISATFAMDFPFTSEYVTGGARPGLVLWASDVALVVLLGLLFAQAAARTHAPPASRPAGRGALIVAMLVLLLVWEVYSASGATLGRHAMFQILQDAVALPLIAVVLLTVRRVDDVGFVVRLLLAGLAIHVTVASLQIANGGPFGLSFLGEVQRESLDYRMFSKWGAEEVRIAGLSIGYYFSGFVGAPYKLAGLAVLLLPSAVVVAATATGHRRLAWYALFFVGLLIVLLSMSRGAWAALAIALATTWWLLRGATGSGGRRLMPSGRVVGVLVLLGALPLLGVLRARLLETNLEITFLQRVELIRAGLSMLERPLVGLGPNNFATLFLGAAGVNLPAGTPIHNIYAVHLVETGVIGLAIFAGLLLGIVSLGVRLSRRGDGATALYAAGITGGLTGFMAWGLTEWIYRDHPLYLTFWLLAGSLVALHAQAGRTGRIREATDSPLAPDAYG